MKLAWSRFISLALVLSFTSAHANLAFAEDLEELRRILVKAKDVRVRAQAALALGRKPSSDKLIEILAEGLNDKSEIVRSAVVSALGRMNGPKVAVHLHRASKDKSPAVREQAKQVLDRLASSGALEMKSYATNTTRTTSHATLYWVTIGQASSRSKQAHSGMVKELRDRLAWKFSQIDDVVVLPTSASSRVDKSRPKIRIESRIVNLSSNRKGADLVVRCEVSLMVMDERSSVLRAMVKGIATGRDSKQASSVKEQEERLAMVALDAAVDSAVEQTARALPQIATGF